MITDTGHAYEARIAKLENDLRIERESKQHESKRAAQLQKERDAARADAKLLAKDFENWYGHFNRDILSQSDRDAFDRLYKIALKYIEA